LCCDAVSTHNAAEDNYEWGGSVDFDCMIRRECVIAIDGYDERVPVMEDVDFYTRAISKFGFGVRRSSGPRLPYPPDSLMHGQKDRQGEQTAYRQMHRVYRRDHNTAEFVVMMAQSRMCAG
jgi:hypothetical protein